MLQSIQKWTKYTFIHTQSRLVLFLTVSVFCIILAVSITSYYSSKSVLQEELSEPQQQLLRISMNFIDEYIKESDQIAIKLALNRNVYTFLTSEAQNSLSNITEIYQQLTTLINNTKTINSIYIYDIRRNSFVAMPQGYHSNAVTFADSKWAENIDNLFEDKIMVVRKREVPEGVGNMGSEITLFRKIMINNELRGVVAINLNYEELFSKLHPPHMSSINSMRYIIDPSNDILYSTSNFQFDPELMGKEIAELNEKSLADITHQNKQFLANQIHSPLTGWRYISIVSQDSLLAKSKKIRNVVFSVSLASLLLGVITIFYINAVAFRPVRRMQQLFHVKDRDMLNPDLIHLEKLTGELLSDHAQLSQLIRQTITEASSKFLYDYCTGNIHSLREVREKWKSYFPGWTDAPLTMAVISIDNHNDWSRRFPSTDHSLLKFALANVVAEVLASHWRSECVDFGKDKLAIVLQESSAGVSLESKFSEAVLIVSRLLKFSVSVGISTAQPDVSRLQQAMFEADNALSYRFYQGYGSVISFLEVSEHEMPESKTKDNVLDEITIAIEAGDTARSLRLMENMIEEIKSNRWYPSTALSVMKKIAEKLHRIGRGEDSELWEEQELFDLFNSIYLDDIAEILQRQVKELAERFERLIQSKDFIICQQMIEYMKQHLGDPIGIQEIADSIGISVSLASQVFKQEMSETIYGYFTQLRMERAGELLQQTDDKVSDIALKVGYQHENSFIRVFRKYNDITPGKYREMMKHRKDTFVE
jgi:AraC-like DNA-binding protein